MSLQGGLLKLSAFILLASLASFAPVFALAEDADPLPSWNDGAAKQSIIKFVEDVTREGSPNFAPVEKRIATFDNDGTLWIEQPMYVQMVFALDRLRELLPLHPEWREQQPFKAALERDFKTLLKDGARNVETIIGVTHAGMTPEKFDQIVKKWLATAEHPRFHRPYTELVYQPMLEVLAYFRAKGFKTFIVTGGGIEFVRAFAEKIYGVPPEQVIGSSIVTKFERRNGQPWLFRYPQVSFVDDGPGKPVGIESHIGRRPIAAFGNSDGDLEMLQWATGAGRRGLGLLVHHTDPVREYAYDKDSIVGHLDVALEAAKLDDWTVADMKKDWKVIFPFEMK
ncbi:MAG: HAD family hydrolase [Methylocella sp.]